MQALTAPSEGQPPERDDAPNAAAEASRAAHSQEAVQADDISALKIAYKDAKKRSAANPSDADLKANYKEAKRRYTRASRAPPHPNPAAIPQGIAVREVSDQPNASHMEELQADLALLKSAYKEAKRRCAQDPTNNQLTAAYKEQKRLYKQAATAPAAATLRLPLAPQPEKELEQATALTRASAPPPHPNPRVGARVCAGGARELLPTAELRTAAASAMQAFEAVARALGARRATGEVAGRHEPDYPKALVLLASAPDLASETDASGWMLLHHAANRQEVPLSVLRKLVEADPMALTVKGGGNGQVPFEIACDAKAAPECLGYLSGENWKRLFLEGPAADSAAKQAKAIEKLRAIGEQIAAQSLLVAEAVDEGERLDAMRYGVPEAMLQWVCASDCSEDFVNIHSAMAGRDWVQVDAMLTSLQNSAATWETERRDAGDYSRHKGFSLLHYAVEYLAPFNVMRKIIDANPKSLVATAAGDLERFAERLAERGAYQRTALHLARRAKGTYDEYYNDIGGGGGGDDDDDDDDDDDGDGDESICDRIDDPTLRRLEWNRRYARREKAEKKLFLLQFDSIGGPNRLLQFLGNYGPLLKAARSKHWTDLEAYMQGKVDPCAGTVTDSDGYDATVRWPDDSEWEIDVKDIKLLYNAVRCTKETDSSTCFSVGARVVWADAAGTASPAGWVLQLAAENGAEQEVIDVLCKASLTAALEGHMWAAVERDGVVTLDRCKELGERGQYPMEIALIEKAPETVLLQLHEAFPEVSKTKNANGQSMLEITLIEKAPEAVLLQLHEAFPEVSKTKNANGQSMFEIALIEKAPETVLLRLHEAFPEAKNANGQSMLEIALIEKAPEAVLMRLHESLPEVSGTKNANGQSMLEIALIEKAPEAVLMRLMVPEASKTKNANGQSMLEIALIEKAPESVLLQLHEAFPEVSKTKNTNGQSVLEIALIEKAPETVLLRLHEAFPEVSKTKNTSGQSMLEIALIEKAPEAVLMRLHEAFPEVSKTKNANGQSVIEVATMHKAPASVQKALLDAHDLPLFEDWLCEHGYLAKKNILIEWLSRDKELRDPLRRLAWMLTESQEKSKEGLKAISVFEKLLSELWQDDYDAQAKFRGAVQALVEQLVVEADAIVCMLATTDCVEFVAYVEETKPPRLLPGRLVRYVGENPAMNQKRGLLKHALDHGRYFNVEWLDDSKIEEWCSAARLQAVACCTRNSHGLLPIEAALLHDPSKHIVQSIELLIRTVGGIDVKLDVDGRTSGSILRGAKQEIYRRIVDTYDAYLRCYRIMDLVHKSSTAKVFTARDVRPGKHFGQTVVIKLMRQRDQFIKEIQGRYGASGHPLDSRAVIALLCWHTPAGKGYTCSATGQKEQSEHTLHGNYCLVMEAGERSLHSACATERIAGYDVDLVRSVCYSVVSCVHHLHEANVLHADLKPRNILRLKPRVAAHYDVELESEPIPGLQSEHAAHKPESKEAWILCDMDAATQVGQPVGEKTSSAYAPPELAREKYGRDGLTIASAKTSFDVWSFGVILFEMCSGRALFAQDTNNDELISTTDRVRLCTWHTITDDEMEPVLKDAKAEGTIVAAAKNLIRWCLQGDPSQRPTIAQVWKHPFLTESHNQSLPKALPMRYHGFLSHAQADASGTVGKLYFEYARLGLHCWLDMKQANLTLEGMRQGVCDSEVFIFILSESVLGSWFCQQELLCAIANCKKIQLILEEESRFHPFDTSHWQEQKVSEVKQRTILVKSASGEVEAKKVVVSMDPDDPWQKERGSEQLTRILCEEIDRQLPNAVVFRRRDFEVEAMMRELCRRNGVVLPTLPRQVWPEETEGSNAINVLVISNDVGTARRMLDELESELGCIGQFNLTKSANGATTADCVLLLLSRGVLHGPSLDCLIAAIDENKRVQQDRIVAVYDPSEWQFGCQEQKQAPDVVQECLNSHEAMTFRPRDPDGPNRHEFPAMVAQLRLKLVSVGEGT